jgi:hypothetical protein
MDAGGVGDKRGRRRGARRTWRSSPLAAALFLWRPRPPGGAVSLLLSPCRPPGPPWRRRPLRAPPLLLFHFLTHSSSHSCPHPRKLFRCPRRFICLPSLIHYSPASTLSLVSCRTGSAPAPPPSRRRSPYFRREPGPPPRPITEGISPRPPIGVEPAFFHQGGGVLAQFPQAFAGGRFSPSRRPPSRPFPLGGVWRRRHTPPPPISKRSLRGADLTREARWALA